MGYPDNLQAVNRMLNKHVLLTSTAFSRFDKLNFGARMALLDYNDEITVWSPIPFGNEVVDALNILKGTNNLEATSFNVKYLIIPDREHTMAVRSFKEQFPELKILGPDSVNLGDISIDYRFGTNVGNKVLSGSALQQVGIKNSTIEDNFEFVYLPYHSNNELVMYDKRSKTIFAADIIFNLGVPGTTEGKVTLEQYSPETGYTKFNPHQGWSFMTRYLQPHSRVGRLLLRNIMDTKRSSEGLKAINNFDFDTWVLCHGNVLEKDGKEAFQALFGADL